MRPSARSATALLTLAILAPATVGAQAPEPAVSPSPAASTPASAADAASFNQPEWTRLTVEGPPAREDATWTVNADATGAFLFGGRDGRTSFDDLWRFDLATDTWTRLRTERGPSARSGHSAAWVEGIGLVIFGGQRGTDFFDDLWAYDPSSDRWRELPPRGQSPAARYGTCAVVDAAGRFVISHGFTFNGRFDDTRAYDFERERWIALAPDGRRPGERCLHECLLDASGRLVLYGGQDDGSRALGDLWVLNGDRWLKEPDPRPAARRLFALAEAGPDVWLFGGAGRDDGVLDDLWRVDRGTLAFVRVRPEGSTPAARSAAVLVADPTRERLLLFGGEARAALGDLWQLRDATGSAAATPTPEPSPMS